MREMNDDLTISIMKRYITASRLGKARTTLQLRGPEMHALLRLGGAECFDAAALAFWYDLARGYRAGKRAAKAQKQPLSDSERSLCTEKWAEIH